MQKAAERHEPCFFCASLGYPRQESHCLQGARVIRFQSLLPDSYSHTSCHSFLLILLKHIRRRAFEEVASALIHRETGLVARRARKTERERERDRENSSHLSLVAMLPANAASCAASGAASGAAAVG